MNENDGSICAEELMPGDTFARMILNLGGRSGKPCVMTFTVISVCTAAERVTINVLVTFSDVSVRTNVWTWNCLRTDLLKFDCNVTEG